MRGYNKILIWENKKRISLLIKFRNLVVEYFKNVETFTSSGLDINFFYRTHRK